MTVKPGNYALEQRREIAAIGLVFAVIRGETVGVAVGQEPLAKLKIPRPLGHESSSLSPGTSFLLDQSWGNIGGL